MSTEMARERAGKARARLFGSLAYGQAEVAKSDAAICSDRKEIGYGG